MTLTTQSKKTLDQLKAKSTETYPIKVRMPSLKSISKMLDEMKVAHTFGDTTHIVEFGVADSGVVGDRHDGKQGHDLKVLDIDKNGKSVYSRYGSWSVDTSETYYSWNTRRYAAELLTLLKSRKVIK